MRESVGGRVGSSPARSLLGGFGGVGLVGWLVVLLCMYLSRYPSILRFLFCSVLFCSVLFCCQLCTYLCTLIVHIEEMMDRLELLADTVCKHR